ncbi:acyl-CoA dehydrogenase family protein [Mycobacterium sp. C31M]
MHVDLAFSEEQVLLQSSVRKLLSQGGDFVWSSASDFDAALWTELAELGVFDFAIDGIADSDDGGVREAMIVLHELGRSMARVPYLEVAVLARALIEECAAPEHKSQLLGGIASGEQILVPAFAEPDDGTLSASPATVAREEGGRWIVSGVKEPVAYGAAATRLLVTASVGGEARLLLVDPRDAAVEVSAYPAVDYSPTARVVFGDAPAELLDVAAPLHDRLSRIEAIVQTAASAQAVGVMERALELTVDHLKARRQFGRPLGDFQALAHRAADMYMAIELARSAALYATLALAGLVSDPLAAAGAKLRAGHAGRFVGQHAIQLHGGIGVTREHAIAHYVARLISLDVSFGTSQEMLDLLAGRIDQYELRRIV